jgi:5-methylcytosine-specific restriction endonuclease McrA
MTFPAAFDKWFQENINKIKGQYFIEWDAKTRAGNPPVIKKKKSKKRRPTKKKTPSYREYMKSAAWKALSRKFREEAGCCEVCGTTEQLQCHHLHYKTLGREKREDIQVVCMPCHCKIHGVKSFKKK